MARPVSTSTCAARRSWTAWVASRSKGFGSDAYPFKGALNLGDRTLTVNKTLFNNIELSDANSTVKLTWKGTDAQPIVAAKVTGADKTLAATVTVDTPKSDTGKGHLQARLATCGRGHGRAHA